MQLVCFTTSLFCTLKYIFIHFSHLSLLKMSTVFNYDAPGVARTYDRTRHTLGTDVVAGLLQVHSGKALKVKQMFSKIVSECDQEIPQSQTADKPMEPR